MTIPYIFKPTLLKSQKICISKAGCVCKISTRYHVICGILPLKKKKAVNCTTSIVLPAQSIHLIIKHKGNNYFITCNHVLKFSYIRCFAYLIYYLVLLCFHCLFRGTLFCSNLQSQQGIGIQSLDQVQTNLRPNPLFSYETHCMLSWVNLLHGIGVRCFYLFMSKPCRIEKDYKLTLNTLKTLKERIDIKCNNM